MPSTLENLAPQLYAASLPVHDATLERFHFLLGKSSTSNQHLAEIIRSDVGFTLAILRQVNQPMPAERDAILKVDHAISLLGMAQTVDIADSLVRFSSLPDESRQALEMLYSNAFHAAQYFESLAVQYHLPHALENGKATRLMKLAEVALWTNQPQAMQHHLHSQQTRQHFAIEPLDYDLRALGLKLAQQWCLPEELQQALSADISWQQLPLSIALADAMACHSSRSWHSPETDYLYELWAEMTDLAKPHVAGIIHRLAAETARQIHDRHLPAPAFFLPQPATVRNEQAAQEKPEKTAENKQAAGRYQTSPTTAATSKQPAKAAGQTNLLQSTLMREMKHMQKIAGTRRVLFAMLTPDRQQLKVRFVLGSDKNDAFRKFIINLQQRSLFSLLMEKPQGIWLNADNFHKYQALIPKQLRGSMALDNLFAMSLFIKGKPVGMFIADHHDTTLTGEQYKQFKLFCGNAARALRGDR
ncbi:MAG: HDOD domain-containing protein [Chromatiales bacterium]|jgi:HD-like signal output (HDOD) protein